MLFLQVGSQTILVTVTADTRIERHYGGNATLGDLHDGDQLDVTGFPNAGGGINAILIRDLSLGPVQPQGTLKVTGMLGVTPSQLTLPVTLCISQRATLRQCADPQRGDGLTLPRRAIARPRHHRHEALSQ